MSPEQREELMRSYRAAMPASYADATTPQKREKLLKYYCLTENPAVVEMLGPNIIVMLAEKYKAGLRLPVPDYSLMGVLQDTIRFVAAPDELKKIGYSALFEGLKSSNVSVRVDTVQYYSEVLKADATDELLRLLDDPDETVRVFAAEGLGKYGRPEVAVQIRQILARRSRGLSPRDVEADYSFRHGHDAIKALEQRNHGKSK